MKTQKETEEKTNEKIVDLQNQATTRTSCACGMVEMKESNALMPDAIETSSVCPGFGGFSSAKKAERAAKAERSLSSAGDSAEFLFFPFSSSED